MDLQLNIALTTLQMKPADRPDASIDSVATWLREKSKIFKQLDDAILTDVARNCSLQMFPANHVLIRQGEIGDCFYIILQGQVAVYICTDLEPGKIAGVKEEAPKQESGHGFGRNKHAEEKAEKKEEKLDRALFGKHILNLGMGASFGELALINDDSVRNASVIVEEPTHFICIDRALYNRSLKGFQARDFEERNNYIETHPLFSQWPWRLKRQVAMSLERATFDFDSFISKQGKPANTLFLIFRGTARLIYNSSTLHSATGGVVPRPSITFDMGHGNSLGVGQKRSAAVASPNFVANGTSVATSQRQQEICSITNGEAIGDLEMFYPIDCYLFTTVAAASTEVLSLSHKNMSRFLENKSISKLTIDMLAHSYYRLKDRVERIHCPVLTGIISNIHQIVDCAESKKAVEAHNKAKRTARRGAAASGKLSARTSISSSGMRPVTVTPPSSGFRRFITQEPDEAALHYAANHASEEYAPEDLEDEDVPPEAKETVFPDWETSDERLTALEERIRRFNAEVSSENDGGSSHLPVNVTERGANLKLPSSDSVKHVVEMRRYTISGQQGPPRAGTLVRVRLSSGNNKSGYVSSLSPSPPASSMGRRSPGTPTSSARRQNTYHGSTNNNPTAASQRNVTFSREITVASIDDDDDDATIRPRSYSLSIQKNIAD